MKRVITIARNELRNLYYSPIAWLSMVVLMALVAFLYVDIVENHIAYSIRKGYSMKAIYELTHKLVGGTGGYFFGFAVEYLYLFIPLITMGLVSREVPGGTIRLLYSSPVRMSEIVLGKFLAMMALTGAILLILTCTLVGFSISVTNPDYGLMLGALGAVLLLLAAYAAIGLFVSSLTSYPIVAAIITFACFYMLSRVIPFLGNGQDVIRQIGYYIGFHKPRLSNLLGGLYNLRDICFFLIVIGSFLTFTIIRMRLAMQSVSPWVKAGRYFAVIAIAFAIAYLTEKPEVNVYADLTRDQINTIVPATERALGQLDKGPLEVIVYSNLVSEQHFIYPSQEISMVRGFWEKFTRFKPDIRVKLVHYYDTPPNSGFYKREPDMTLEQIAAKQAKAHGVSLDRILPPEEIRKLEDVESEEYRIFFRLNYGNKSTILRVFDDQERWPSEREIVAAISRLLDTPPKVAFVSGHIERSPFLKRERDYSSMTTLLSQRMALINQGFDVDTLNLEQEDIVGSLATLVIADPRKPMSSVELNKIKRYINDGGNVLLLIEPDRVGVAQPILDILGLSVRQGMILQQDEEYSSNYVFPYLTDTAQHIRPEFFQSLQKQHLAYGDTAFHVGMIGAGALDYNAADEFHVEPLLLTDSLSSWNRTTPISQDSLNLSLERNPEDEPGSFAVGLRMQRQIRGREQRILVFSDADFISPNKPNRGRNGQFGFWCMSYVSGGYLPADMLRVDTDDSFAVTTVQAMGKQRVVLMYLLPALLALTGSIILIRRKRK